MRSVLVTKHPEIIPESKNQFNRQRKEWIDILLQSKGISSLGVNEMINPPGEFPTCRITSIRPNPSQGDFTVDMDVRKAGEILLLLVSPTGAIISEFDLFVENPGLYRKDITEPSLKPGVYYLLVSVAQEKPDAKKLVIFK